MATCKLIIEDEVNIKIEGLSVDIRRKLANALKFEVPYAKHMPQYKLGRWDGKVAFFGIGGGGIGDVWGMWGGMGEMVCVRGHGGCRCGRLTLKCYSVRTL